jgi:hypothetical protein
LQVRTQRRWPGVPTPALFGVQRNSRKLDFRRSACTAARALRTIATRAAVERHTFYPADNLSAWAHAAPPTKSAPEIVFRTALCSPALESGSTRDARAHGDAATTTRARRQPRRRSSTRHTSRRDQRNKRITSHLITAWARSLRIHTHMHEMLRIVLHRQAISLPRRRTQWPIQIFQQST